MGLSIILTIASTVTICCFLVGLILWGCNTVGTESIRAVYLLYKQGSIRVKKVTLFPPGCEGVLVVAPARLGGHKIFKAKRISLQRPSLRSLIEDRGLVMVLEEPWLNALADLVGQLHVINLLTDVGFMREVESETSKPTVSQQAFDSRASHPHMPTPAEEEEGKADTPPAPVKDSSSSGKTSKLKGFFRRKKDKGKDAAPGEAAPNSGPSTKAPAGPKGLMRSVKVAAQRRFTREEEDFAARESGPLPTPPVGFPPAVSPPAGEQAPSGTATPVSGVSPPSSVKGGSARSEEDATFEEKLDAKPAAAVGSSVATWTGSFHLPFLRVDLQDGLIVLHQEVRQVAGSWVKLDVVLGTPLVRKGAETLGLQTDWLRPENWPADTELTGRLRFAVGLRVQTEHVSARLGGWRTSTGILLRAPIPSTVAFTPALAKYVLARMHPLLANVIAVDEDREVLAAVAPLSLHIPSEAYTIRVQPMKLRFRASVMMRGAIKLLEREHKGGKRGGMECWTSAVECEFYRSGELISKRMDVLVSRDFRVSKAPLHLCAWGRGVLDAQCGSVIDATLAIPAYTLGMAGIPGLPDEYMLQLEAFGSVLNPSIDFLRASGHLAALVVQRNLPSLGIKGVRKWLDTKAEKRVKEGGVIPPPTLPLPWTAFHKQPRRQTASRRRDLPAAPSLEECIRLGITDGNSESVKPQMSNPRDYHFQVSPPQGTVVLESEETQREAAAKEAEVEAPAGSSPASELEEEAPLHMNPHLARQLTKTVRAERGSLPPSEASDSDPSEGEEEGEESDAENRAPPSPNSPRVHVVSPGGSPRKGGPPSLASIRQR